MKLPFKTTFLFFFFLSSSSFSQTNLVPNPSFEICSTCPSNVGEINKAISWNSYGNTPDYFNACATSTTVTVPLNGFGFQSAATGNAYCGLYVYDGDTTSIYREYIGAQLLNTLSIGQKYYVSVKISLCGGPSSLWAYGTNKMGMLFSTIPYSISNPVQTNNFSQYYSLSVVTDTTNWVFLSGSFISDSLYQFISLGNFFDDINTDTTILNSSFNAVSYYYLDDICVSTDSVLCNSPDGFVEFNDENIFVSPNPANNTVLIVSKIVFDDDVIIMNSLGEIVEYIHAKSNNEVLINCFEWSNGLYFFKINKNYYKIIIQH